MTELQPHNSIFFFFFFFYQTAIWALQWGFLRTSTSISVFHNLKINTQTPKGSNASNKKKKKNELSLYRRKTKDNASGNKSEIQLCKTRNQIIKFKNYI